VIHPAITLANVGTLERRDVPFDFYGEGVTDSIARLLATVDRERMTIAEALGAPAMSLLEWASIVYGVEAPDLVELYRRLAALVYQGIGTPPDLAARYVTEDVPLGLVPLLALGAIAGVDTPTISGLVSILGALTGTDFGGTGRTAARMGINDLSAADLRRSVGVDGSDRVEPGAHGMAGSTA
jgi:opine dehydrogenase